MRKFLLNSENFLIVSSTLLFSISANLFTNEINNLKLNFYLSSIILQFLAGIIGFFLNTYFHKKKNNAAHDLQIKKRTENLEDYQIGYINKWLRVYILYAIFIVLGLAGFIMLYLHYNYL